MRNTYQHTSRASTHASTHHYQGYSVSPSAFRLPDGSFTANLVLERLAGSPDTRYYRFDALDYFDSESQAIQHSCHWARHWVDTRG